MNEWLSRIEEENGIDILFACEAGSRAWGVAEEESDFDVRFIFRYRSLKKYLALKKAPSVLEIQSLEDVSGFDLFKAFELISKSNPSIYEWAYSPLVYKGERAFVHQLKKVVETNYSPFTLYQHYESLRNHNIKDISKGEYSYKKQKQLLLAVRAELIRTGIRGAQSVQSPFTFIDAARHIEPEIFLAYNHLANAKRNHFLLKNSEFNSILKLLEISINDKESGGIIPNTPPVIAELEEWLWAILGV